jgi:hypothetical protein
MTGIHLEYFVCRGWGSSAMYMLITIVDPTISYLGVSLFLVLTCINSLISTSVIAFFVGKFDMDPLTTPTEYGNLVTMICCIPLVLSIPFFIYAGLVMRSNKILKIMKGEFNILEDRKCASDYIKSLHNAEDGVGFLG